MTYPMSFDQVWPRLLVVGAGAWLFAHVAAKLVHDWAHDDNYSHGFLIVPLALYFAWERRDRLHAAARTPSWAGLGVIVFGLCVLVAGQLGAELFLTRVSLVIVLVGAVLFLEGWPRLRVLGFPIAFLLLMIPIPAIIFNQIAFPLQLLASRVGAWTMQACAVPVLREGNVILLANTSLEVAEACSGIRSLVSLLTLGMVYGYFADSRLWVRAVITCATVPIAIGANAFRVAGTGLLAHYYGPETAQGFFHEFSGWLVFISAFGMLVIVVGILRRLAPPAVPAGRPVAA